MKNELSTKLYKLDFKELVNNATNKAYWNKKWEIFNYDGMSVEFFLESINIVHNKLNGKIRLTLCRKLENNDIQILSVIGLSE